MSISSELAMDLLPHAVGIYEKLDLKAVGTGIMKQVKKENPNLSVGEVNESVGEKVIIHIIKNLPKVKDEVFSMVALVSGISLEQAKAQSLAKTMAAFKGIFSDPELLAFFKGAM